MKVKCVLADLKRCQTDLYTRSLSVNAAKTQEQSFITRHLDYCNALFSGITDSLFRRLESVQNAAARLVTGTRRRDHITPVLRQLHWLPVQQRVDVKLALLVYKALHGGNVASRRIKPLKCKFRLSTVNCFSAPIYVYTTR